MTYWMFLVVPAILILLIFGYVSFINSFANTSTSTSQSSEVKRAAGAQVIGVGQAVTVQVIRASNSYLFGLVRLPSYAQGIGSLILMNTIFFWSLIPIAAILTYGLVLIQRGNITMVAWRSQRSFDKSSIWMKLGKSLGIGALFSLVTYLIFSTDSGVSLALGLLVAYMEFRMTQE